MTDPAGPSCVIGRRPHPADEGQLCRHHLEELGGWLRDVEDEAARLSTAPRLETSYDTGGTSLASHRSPVVLDAVVMLDGRSAPHAPRVIGPVCVTCPAGTGARCACPPTESGWRDVHWAGCPRGHLHPSCLVILSDRDEYESGAAGLASILGVLHGWAQTVRDERRLEPPAGDVITALGPIGEWARTITVAPTVMSERRVLTRHLAFMAGRDYIARFRADIAGLRATLLRANRNDDPRPLPGYCYRLVDGAECHGPLWPADPAHTSGYESASGLQAVACGRNPEHRWEGSDLVRLLVIVDAQRAEARKEAVS